MPILKSHSLAEICAVNIQSKKSVVRCNDSGRKTVAIPDQASEV